MNKRPPKKIYLSALGPYFMLEQLIFGTIQLIVIHALTMIPCLLVNLSVL